MIVNYLKEVLVMSVYITLLFEILFVLKKPAWLWEEIAAWLEH